MKSLLFINRVYPPDHGATGQLLEDLARGLAARGFAVTVLTTGPKREEDAPVASGGINILRVHGLPFSRASFVRRAVSYLSLYPALLWRAWRLPRHDVVVTLTDPPLVLVLAPLIRLCKRSRPIHWAQDVYPELAEELGVLRQQSLGARLLRAVSNWALRRHEQIIAVGECMKARLIARGIPAEKVSVIPNWAVGVESPRAHTRESTTFTVMYSGNFGLAHTFDAIIAAVKNLEAQSAPVRFIFTGSGPKFDFVQRQLSGSSIAEFRPPVALSELNRSLASADVHLASMIDSLCGLVVPSKIYGALAAGRPCVFIGPSASEAARLLERTGCGVALAGNDGGAALTELLRSWANHPEELAAMRARCELSAVGFSEPPIDVFARFVTNR